MKKCLCFQRVSSLRQDLTAQREAVIKAAGEKYKKSEIIEVQGKESAIKLDEMERQTLNEMKSYVELYPSIESIYFFSVDRLARRVSVVMSIKEWADEKKINLVFLNPYPFSTWFRTTDGEWKKNEISDIYLMFLSFGAKMEMEIKNERFAAAKALNKQNNRPNGKILYGYTTDENKNLAYDKPKAKVVRWIFDCYLKKGKSTAEIFDEGVELGYWQDLKARTSKANHIRIILKNYCYAGKPNNSGLVYPAIVDVEEIDEAIKLMNSKFNKPKSYTRNTYLCKGILKDEMTGYTMIANRWHVKYNIRQKVEGRYGVNINVADTLLWRTAFECKWNLLSHADEGQQDNIKEQLTDISTRIVTLKERIEKDIQPRYSKAYDAFVNGRGRITQQMYDNTISSLDNEHREIQNKIESLEKRETELYSLLDELMNKEKMDISIYTLKEITDDKQRLEIIKECITGMTVKKIGHKKYIFKVHSLMYTSPNTYLYMPKGGSIELYWVTGKVNNLEEINVSEGLENSTLIPIEDEIETRFTRGK